MQIPLTRRQFATVSIAVPLARLVGAAAAAQEVKLESEFLFDLTIETRAPVARVGLPGRERLIVEVLGGTFSGPALKGTLKGPSGDWIEQRGDGSSALDVRLLMQTDDGGDIYTSWRGISYMPPGGPQYARILPLFETRASRYEWLNHIVSVGVYQPAAGHIGYRVFRIL
jgi:hypothetical protein